MTKTNKTFQVLRTDGETMETKADGKFLTEQGAQGRKRALRAKLPAGSSDSLSVKETRRTGRR